MADLKRQRGAITRFLLAGGFNTAVTYVIYLLLLPSTGHRIAYSVAFGLGMVLAYFTNRYFVFRSHAGARSVVATPLIYALQYIVGLGIVEAWVTLFKLPAVWAPLVAVVLTIPMTYGLNRLAFRGTRKKV